MSVSLWIASALFYAYIMLWVYVLRDRGGFSLARLINKAPTYESRIVITTLGVLLWPIWVVWHITSVLQFGKRIFKGIWKVFYIYGKGIRDLLPRKAAKIPEARVLTKDQEKG